MNDIQAGSLAGFAATVPMTMVMEELHERLPWWQHYPLPPRQIAMNMAKKAAVRHHLTEEHRLATTLAAHFTVGTSAGALYAPISRYLGGPGPVSGAVFGLGVWAVNYLAILPALGLLDPATQHPQRRTRLMIAAHLVWGATTGVLVAAAKRRKRLRASRQFTHQKSDPFHPKG